MTSRWSEVTVPTRELLVYLGLIDRETIKVDVAGALKKKKERKS